MTKEEALCVQCKWEEDANKLPCACQSCSDHFTGVCWMPEAYNLAKTKLQGKYRWHDLRENPDDLPDEMHHVMTIYRHEDKELTDYHIDYLEDGVWDKSYDYNMDYWRVKAWREIEPFEEDAE